jgi:hypothetical protein
MKFLALGVCSAAANFSGICPTRHQHCFVPTLLAQRVQSYKGDKAGKCRIYPRSALTFPGESARSMTSAQYVVVRRKMNSTETTRKR